MWCKHERDLSVCYPVDCSCIVWCSSPSRPPYAAEDEGGRGGWGDKTQLSFMVSYFLNQWINLTLWLYDVKIIVKKKKSKFHQELNGKFTHHLLKVDKFPVKRLATLMKERQVWNMKSETRLSLHFHVDGFAPLGGTKHTIPPLSLPHVPLVMQPWQREAEQGWRWLI